MATPADTVDIIIQNALDLATEHESKMEHYTDFGVDIATQGRWTSVTPFSWTKTVDAVEPPVPTAGSPTDIYDQYLADTIAYLTSLLDDFFTTYYPLTNDAYDDGTAWLINTITNGGTGIPAAIEDQIWQRARDRITNDSRHQEQQIVAGFAARGFSMPPGVMVKAVKELRYKQMSAKGELSSSIAIKQAEIEIENIKFAVTEAMKSRLAALAAAGDFIRAFALAPEIATKISESDADAQARLMSATADLYRARLSRDELVMNTEIAKMGNFQGDQKLYWDTRVARDEQKVRAALNAAEGFSRTTMAALSSLNSVASVASSSFE